MVGLRAAVVDGGEISYLCVMTKPQVPTLLSDIRHPARRRVAQLALMAFWSIAATEVSADATPADAAAPLLGGQLQPAGAFPHDQHGYVVATLPDGKVLAYGYDSRGVAHDGRQHKSTLRDFGARVRDASLTRNDYLWHPGQRAWKKVGAPPECPHRRYLHTLTALPGGKVLAAGGLCDEPRLLNETQRPFAPHTHLSLWNGAVDAWEPAPSLTVARIFHSASLRPDGSVLIAGGESDPLLADTEDESVLTSVELYRDGRVQALPDLHVARARHAAATVSGGGVLVVGGIGRNGKPIAAAEQWDPVQEIWRAVAPMRQSRFDHSATVLDDGRVMVAGGIGADGIPIASVEIWDPQRDEWTAGDPLLLPVREHAAARLSDGSVLILGGADHRGETVRIAMRWEKAVARWLPAGLRLPGDSLPSNPPTAALVPSPDGSAQAFTHGAIYHWMRDAETTRPFSHYRPRLDHTTTATTDERVLIAGGRSDGTLVDWAEIFDPATQRFALTGRMAQPRAAHTALALPGGAVVVAGGAVTRPDAPNRRAESHPEVWDPVSGIWHAISDIRIAAQERVHMGLQRDGSVLFVASREATDDESDIQGAYRAWNWDIASGRVQARQVHVAPRSRAGIAILADGRVLIVGGNHTEFVPAYRCPPRPADDDEGDEAGCQDEPEHWQAYAVDSVELWDSHLGTVRTLEPPRQWNARYPLTLVLRNGNVVLTEYRPSNVYWGRQPARVLLWNGQTGAWQELPTLDGDETPALIELADGTLVTHSKRLPSGATAWLSTPAIQKADARPVQLSSRRVLAVSSDAPHLALYDETAEQWRLPRTTHAPPPWISKPVLLPLADGQLMAIGDIGGGARAVTMSFIWNPADARWSVAGQLQIRSGQPSQAVQLPSRRVIYLGTYQDRLVCETWLPANKTWQSCENFAITEKPDRADRSAVRGKVVLDTLDDGRALVFGGTDAFIFDEVENRWTKTRVEWSKEPIHYGAPIRPTQPYAQALDPRSQTWLDTTAAATKYREWNYNISAPAMLWDRKRRQWDYVFQPGTAEMGKDAVRLPGGCAFSWRQASWRIFDPTTGEVTRHIDPAIDAIAADVAMTVLADGTAVFAAASFGAPTELLFQTRGVGCAGFAPQTNDAAAMPPVLYEERAATRQAAAIPPAAPPGRARSHDRIWEYRWLALAILGPLVFYAFARRALPPRMRAGVRPRPGTRGNTVATPAIGSRGFRWTLRLLLYGTALIVAVPLLANIVFFKGVEMADESCEMVATACLDAKTGILKPMPSLARQDDAAATYTQIPCRYVGTWSSIRPDKVYRIVLEDSGHYRMSNNTTGAGNTSIDQGYWAVQGDHMLWRSEKHVAMAIDANPIVVASETRFDLVEKDGRHTRFELISPSEPHSCSP
jgi:hypothetical protein